jgi:hypothetical protein
MEASVVSVALSESFERAEAAKNMFDANAAAGKGGVERTIFGRSGFGARFAAGRGAGRMKRFDPDIGEITQDTDVGPEPLREPRLPQEFQIVGRATDARWDVHDPAALVHGDLDLEGVLLLLATVVGVGHG